MRTWNPEPEPETVGLVEDADGQLWQRCRDSGWQQVPVYRGAGLERVGRSWGYVLGEFGPLTEVEEPE